MVRILTSGVALGVHVPGLLLADRLRERGVPAEVDVLERLLPQQKLATTARMKWAFHRDFRLSLVGMRTAGSPADVADETAVSALLDRWQADGVRRFAVWSGFWLPIVARYAERCASPPRVDLCHIDSVHSPSFTKTAVHGLDTADVWMVDAPGRRIPCTIPVSTEPPVDWARRTGRLYVHGGGWGMGTYRDRIGELRAVAELDVLAYEPADAERELPGVRYFMMDPEWHPWFDNGYPPLGEVRTGRPTDYRRGDRHPGSFDLTRTATATVSKPGGGTLLDSLWSATPLVLLEPWGDHEASNAELWQRLGFGITFDGWRDRGFDPGVLAELHQNLLRATENLPDYPRRLAAEVHA